MQACFILLAYKSEPETVMRLIRSLDGYKVYLVDNTVETGFRLDHLFKQNKYQLPKSVRIINSGVNLGYAGGVNIGLKKAVKDGFTWMTVLNPDLVCSRNAINLYIGKLDYTEAGIAGIFPGSLDSKRFTTVTGDYISPENLRYLSGSFISIHRNVIDKIGWLPEQYFLYYEEAEYCFRAGLAGFKLTYLPVSGVNHHDATGLGKGSFLHQYYLSRNHLLFVERNAPFKVRMRELIRLPKTISEHINKGESGGLTGVCHYLLRRFGRYQGGLC